MKKHRFHRQVVQCILLGGRHLPADLFPRFEGHKAESTLTTVHHPFNLIIVPSCPCNLRIRYVHKFSFTYVWLMAHFAVVTGLALILSGHTLANILHQKWFRGYPKYGVR